MEGYLYFVFFGLFVFILTSFKITREFIINFLPEFLITISNAGFTIVGVMSSSDKKFLGQYNWEDIWVWLFFVFFIIYLMTIYIGAKRNHHNKSVQSEIDRNKKLIDEIESYKSEYYKLCSNNILNMFSSFFTTGNERISIYKHQGDHFTLLGRYAKNPEHNKPTRYQYLENEGLIGKGWTETKAIVQGAPKWVGKGIEYKKFMKERCKITDKRLKKIRMKSQSIFIKTLHDDKTADDPDGIIVFESISTTKVKEQECLELIKNKQNELLTLLKNMKSLTKKAN